MYDPDTQQIPEPVHPPTPLVREIMWYLCEGNFRIELYTLDSVLYDANRSTSGPRTTRGRTAFVQSSLHWFGTTALPRWVDTKNGFCAPDTAARYDAARLLTVMMRDWVRDPKCVVSKEIIDKSAELHTRSQEGQLDLAEVIEYEKKVFEHYIRCYAHVFRRAPTIPHVFPSPIPDAPAANV